MISKYRMCTRCIMDTTALEIEFDEKGVCNFCRRYDEFLKKYPLDTERGKEQLDKIVEEVRKGGRGKDYDCVIGLSGGIDSSYVACKVVELGLRPLAIHFDSGWNSEISVSNIEKTVKKLNLQLYTFVCDWEEMRNLQLSFLKASVANCDVPQDHAFYAMLWHTARKMDVKYIISGHNMSTESILPTSWGYNCLDLRHIMGIQRRFGSIKLKNYPKINFFNLYIYYPHILGIQLIHILNYMTYDKQSAKEYLKNKIGWRDYGGKHHESIWTRFFQAYYLPKKFGYDKRKAHLSSLIVSGQIKRDEALEEMKKDLYPEDKLREDKAFVLKKLNLTEKQFEEVMALPNKTFRDYPSNYLFFQTGRKLASLFR